MSATDNLVPQTDLPGGDVQAIFSTEAAVRTMEMAFPWSGSIAVVGTREAKMPQST